MTNEEAILWLVSIAEHEGEQLRICAEDAKALQMGIDAIKALEQQPCEDAISREAVLDIINNPLNIRLDEIIKKLPSVTPKTGWIPISEGLPTERNHYLITVKIDGMNGCKPYYEIQKSWYSDKQFVVEYIGDGLVAKRSVIAWMPLPTSYQGGEQ